MCVIFVTRQKAANLPPTRKTKEDKGGMFCFFCSYFLICSVFRFGASLLLTSRELPGLLVTHSDVSHVRVSPLVSSAYLHFLFFFFALPR